MSIIDALLIWLALSVISVVIAIAVYWSLRHQPQSDAHDDKLDAYLMTNRIIIDDQSSLSSSEDRDYDKVFPRE